jgi:hypothetical protein
MGGGENWCQIIFAAAAEERELTPVFAQWRRGPRQALAKAFRKLRVVAHANRFGNLSRRRAVLRESLDLQVLTEPAHHLERLYSSMKIEGNPLELFALFNWLKQQLAQSRERERR